MAILKTKTVKGGEVTELEMDIFYLNQIPDVMDKMGWSIASELMKYWFNTKPAFEMDDALRNTYMKGKSIDIPKERYNDTIVKMNWAVNYKQVQDAIDILINKKLGNKASNDSIFKRLLKRNLVKSSSEKEIYVGYGSDIIDIDYTSQINVETFGGNYDAIDELRGAIGKGSLNLCVRGYYDLSQKKNRFVVDKIGFYIKDAYNFSGDYEPLGIWSRNDILGYGHILKFMTTYKLKDWRTLYKEYKGYVPVFNKDFRSWQRKHNEGGDYIVFSDVYWIEPPSEHQVIYESN
ncbi:DUF6402 family protein [Xenorhabdus doucetiae]|uniref:Uncharacterized protein n=1 Tax=Xenorhabdus doucetiae TaxID=351671 RepID=A0A068QV65_9GAMM|nr:DUF6402 family protein [Xenorhabdus doucetiae]TYP11650.1 hypothetical protein LY16_01009 [Xenorhabdus doucetiae]CDG17720.1 conserved protein of unknown function [Xenorhabdus doucetiae]